MEVNGHLATGIPVYVVSKLLGVVPLSFPPETLVPTLIALSAPRFISPSVPLDLQADLSTALALFMTLDQCSGKGTCNLCQVPLLTLSWKPLTTAAGSSTFRQIFGQSVARA